MNSPVKPAGLDEELASKWIDDPKTEAESAWNSMILLYKEYADDLAPYSPAHYAYIGFVKSLAEILGIFEDESQ